jgi:hypothetical protein
VSSQPEHWHVGDQYIIEHIPQGETFKCDECDQEHIAYWWVHDHRYNDSTRATSKDEAIQMVVERLLEDFGGVPARVEGEAIASAVARITEQMEEGL